MNKKEETIRTYSKGAIKYATKFSAIGPYKKDIQKAFSLVNKKNPRVVELGCGGGKDALEILNYTDTYLGIDGAEGMIEIARKTAPMGSFVVADFEEYDFPLNTDLFFAFTSLLDLDKEG